VRFTTKWRIDEEKSRAFFERDWACKKKCVGSGARSIRPKLPWHRRDCARTGGNERLAEGRIEGI
jgi:hypothetical protein